MIVRCTSSYGHSRGTVWKDSPESMPKVSGIAFQCELHDFLHEGWSVGLEQLAQLGTFVLGAFGPTNGIRALALLKRHDIVLP